MSAPRDMSYRVTIYDDGGPVPGKIERGGFAFKADAKVWAERELEAAAELFTDGRANLRVSILEERK